MVIVDGKDFEFSRFEDITSKHKKDTKLIIMNTSVKIVKIFMDFIALSAKSFVKISTLFLCSKWRLILRDKLLENFSEKEGLL